MSGFDLSTVNLTAAADKATTLRVIDPRTGSPIVILSDDAKAPPQYVEIDLLGIESTVARARRREFQRARLSRASRGKKVAYTPETLEAEKVALFTALTVSWRNVQWKGEPAECTPAMCRTIYGDPIMSWLVDQIEEHVGDMENFLAPSVAGSPDSPDTASS